jgi:hypothetical protein
MSLPKPTLGVPTDYAARIGALFDAFNNGNYAFPATQVPSADPNTLDDYEEGDWTPSLGGSATYTSRYGKYTKTGRGVDQIGQIVVNAIGTGSAGSISGSPFNSAQATAGYVGFFASIATSYTHVGVIFNSGTVIDTTAIAAAGASMTTPATVFANSANFLFGGTYFV